MRSSMGVQAYLPAESLSRLDRGQAPRSGGGLPERSFDEAVARFFSELRRHLGVPRHTIAARLGTTETVLAALEMGHIADLPHGDTLVRLVTSYTALLKLDPRPILTHIQFLQAAATPAQPVTNLFAANQAAPPLASPATDLLAAVRELEIAEQRFADDDDWIREISASVQLVEQEADAASQHADRRARRRRRTAAVFAIVTAPLMAAVLALLVVPQASMVYRAINGLPSSLVAPARDTYNAVLMAIAPAREGLRWIEVDDPKARRTDKLPNSGKSL